MTTSTAYDRILAGLEQSGMRIHVTGAGFRSQCPVHGSRGLTLSVRAGDGRAFVTCFAGCPDTDVLDTIGLSIRDLFDEPLAPDHQPRPRRTKGPLEELGVYLRRPYWLPSERGAAPSSLADEQEIAEHFCRRLEQQKALETMPPHWQHRAEAFDTGRPRRADFPGIALAADVAERGRRCAEIAQACRNRAALDELIDYDPDGFIAERLAEFDHWIETRRFATTGEAA